MSSAIVTGATGILGREIVYRLGNNPKRWRLIHAVSRSKKEDFPGCVKHTSVDLLGSSDVISQSLKDVEAEYLFFAAYMERDSEQENWDVNGDMLQNILNALEKVGITKTLKRIVLVTGAKQYGVHLGEPKNPMDEADPWLTDKRFPPNFYYRQQDILSAFGEKHGIPWTVTYPNDVIGFAKGNFMNLATAIGIYAAVSKELGQDLVFPGSEEFYTKFDCFTSARLHAEFVDWAVDEDQTGNQAFNVVNGDVQSWQSLWPLLAKRFGMEVKEEQFQGHGELSSESSLWDTPPLSLFEKEAGLKGKVKPGKLQQNIDLTKWSKQEDVQKAWENLADKHSLEKDAFDKATWSFLGLVLGRNFDLVINMTKARKMGWTRYVDSWQSLVEVFEELERDKILPVYT